MPHHHPSPRTNPSKTALYHPLFVMPTSICTIRFQIRTILFAFRRGVGLPLPLHQSLLFSLIFVKEHLSLALLAPPVAPNTAIPTQPLQKNNNPSLNTFPTNQKTAPHHRCGLTYSNPYCIAGLPPSRLNISIPARLSRKLTAMNSTTATTAAIHTVLFCFFVQVC